MKDQSTNGSERRKCVKLSIPARDGRTILVLFQARIFILFWTEHKHTAHSDAVIDDVENCRSASKGKTKCDFYPSFSATLSNKTRAFPPKNHSKIWI